MSRFNISVIWVLFFLAFAESLMEDYYYRDIINDGIKLEFFVGEMTPDRQIKIYYDDKLIITQQDTSLSESYVGEKKNLQIIVPDTEILILNPEEINSEKKVIVYHSDGKIHVYQGEEINSTKLVSEFNNSFDSEEIVSILSNEFDQKKLVSIFFANDKLVLTQKETPEEINPNLVQVEKLQTVTSDKNKLLLHPARFSPEKKINIIHKNGEIIVWTGKFDEIPEDSVETPEIVEVIAEKLMKKPLEINPDNKVLKGKNNVHKIEKINATDSKPSDSINKSEINQEITPDLEFDTFFDSGEIAEIFPQEFNLKKLVWIFFCDNQLNVTQLGAPEETSNNIRYKHKNMTIVSSDVNKLLLYPGRITPEDRIRVLHKNRTIYVWQGSDRIPKKHINRPDIVKVIKPTPKIEKPEAVLDKLGNSNFDREILMVLPELNLRQAFSVNINGNNNTRVETLSTPHQKVSTAHGFNNSRIVKSGSNSFVYYPINIDLDFKINIKDNSNASEELKINETNEIDAQPEPIMLHQVIASNYTMRVDPKELILKKLVRVSYNNELLEVTQNGTSEESFNASSSFNQTNLQVIKPETTRLLLHLMFINPDSVIKFRHENGRIYIWQGSDRIPKEDVDMPSVAQIIEPWGVEDYDDEDEDDNESKTVVQDFNKSVSDKIGLTLFSNMYNPDKLIVVKHANDQIHVNQIDRIEDDGNKNPENQKMFYSISNESSVTLDPRKINSNQRIIVKYFDKMTYITV
ncbi:Protein of unknown function [Cotesia congregata]|uniref:Uncharacterized protein n=1 Tax=Cotesia congregata TaxID=51543 RepID=A0A8J2H7Y6_COTCN|nr:Protein of unknown function [Cotesia congregata]